MAISFETPALNCIPRARTEKLARRRGFPSQKDTKIITGTIEQSTSVKFCLRTLFFRDGKTFENA